MDRYSAKPQHLILSAVFLLLGSVLIGLGSEWKVGGAGFILLGILSAGWITYAGMTDSYRVYLDSVRQLAETMSKHKDPNIWASLGFRSPEPNLKAIVQDRDAPNVTDIYSMPVSQPKFQSLADGVLQGSPLSESYWAGKGKVFSSAEFRLLKGYMEDHKLIRPKNLKDPRQGFEITRKGRDLLLKYASPAIREELTRYTAPPPLLLDEGG